MRKYIKLKKKLSLRRERRRRLNKIIKKFKNWKTL